MTTPTVEQAWRNYHKMVYTVCFKYTRNKEDAEDLRQEVFLRLQKSIHLFKGDSLFSSWLYKIAINTSLMHLRKYKRQSQDLSLSDLEADFQEDGSSAWQQALLSQDQELESTIDRLSLTRLLNDLPTGLRTSLALHSLEGLKHEEIAEIFGTSELASKSQFNRALAAAKEMAGLIDPKSHLKPPDGVPSTLFSDLEKYL